MVNNKKTALSAKLPEIAAMVIFIAFFIVVSISHEPWFDEAESWQIARCASLKDILFFIPHYEGHPPLWHLILFIPAKLGAAYEPSIKIIAGVISAIATYLIIFRSPFPRIVRLLLPFNYFLFYQYGIISRPYGLMLLAFLLAAMTFEKRNERPFRFILTLCLLCLTSAYGILMAGGICICWLIDVLKERKWKIAELVKDRRILSLIAIAILAALLILEIMPREDTYATNLENNNSLFVRLIYCFIDIIPECLLSDVVGCDGVLSNVRLSEIAVYSAAIFGIILLICLILLSPKGKGKYFFVPYSIFAAFACFRYLAAHHLGVALMLFIFWMWIVCKDKQKAYLFKKISTRISDKDRKSILTVGKILIVSTLAVPIFWTIAAGVNDILKPYFNSRQVSDFISENIPENARIMITWSEEKNEDGIITYETIDTNLLDFPVSWLPYFEHNIFMNLNEGKDELAYGTHIIASAEENKENLRTWREMGQPDVIIGDVDIEFVYGDEISWLDYAPVLKIEPVGISIWKNQYFGNEEDLNYEYLYVRRDLLDDYGLEEIEADTYNYPYQVLMK